jgi:hypothetical protein
MSKKKKREEKVFITASKMLFLFALSQQTQAANFFELFFLFVRRIFRPAPGHHMCTIIEE